MGWVEKGKKLDMDKSDKAMDGFFKNMLEAIENRALATACIQVGDWESGRWRWRW